jgi:hypothetical protein
MLVVFLVGVVSMILLRTLRKDYAKFAADDDLEEDVAEESGWKQIHADVFRSPSHLVMFSALVGTAHQLMALVFLVLGFAILGSYYRKYVDRLVSRPSNPLTNLRIVCVCVCVSTIGSGVLQPIYLNQPWYRGLCIDHLLHAHIGRGWLLVRRVLHAPRRKELDEDHVCHGHSVSNADWHISISVELWRQVLRCPIVHSCQYNGMFDFYV